MQSFNFCKIQKVSLESWRQEVSWPPLHTFCIAVIVDTSAHKDDSCYDLVIAGIEAGADSVFCWGENASVIADKISLGVASRKYLNKPEIRTGEYFVIVTIHEDSIKKAIDTICSAWVENISCQSRLKTILVLKICNNKH